MRLAILAAATVTLLEPAVASAAPRRPYYITEARMTAVAEEHHNWGLGNIEVLNAACLGQGYARGRFPYQRFHLFLCYIQAAGWTGEYHFNVQTDGRRVIYTPTLITAFPGQ